MVLKRVMSSHAPIALKHEVPVLFHEPHVETGFRQTHQPWSYYFLSLFQKHNECMNSWTHLIGFFLTLSRICQLWNEFSLIGDPHMWPLGAGLITMTVLYLCSTFAHCVSHKSELVHYTGFMIDYAGIGLFGLGSVILHYAYCVDEHMFNSWMKEYAVSIGIVLSILVCLCCSISKVVYKRPYPFTRKIWQIGSVGAIYTWLSIPILHRLVLHLENGRWDESLTHHTAQMFWFALAGFFFGSDIPQRFFPGKFDFFGHSHQIFHICIIFVTQKQLDGLYLDIHRLQPHFKVLDIPTFWSTYGAVLFVICGSTVIVYIFHMIAKHRLLSESKKE